jgi:hypothetical protein
MVSITTIIWLMLLKEITGVYSENYKKPKKQAKNASFLIIIRSQFILTFLWTRCICS